jgi:predicted transcriptional regulator
MEVHFSPELQAKLDRVAAEIHEGADQYVQQLVEHYLDHDVWFRQKVAGSIAQPDNGTFLTHEEVGGRLKKLLQT